MGSGPGDPVLGVPRETHGHRLADLGAGGYRRWVWQAQEVKQAAVTEFYWPGVGLASISFRLATSATPGILIAALVEAEQVDAAVAGAGDDVLPVGRARGRRARLRKDGNDFVSLCALQQDGAALTNRAKSPPLMHRGPGAPGVVRVVCPS